LFKRFILIKKQLEGRRLLHICFNALKPNTKEKFGDVRNVRVSVRILADALVKMKNGAVQPEERIIQAIDYGNNRRNALLTPVERRDFLKDYRRRTEHITEDPPPVIYDFYLPRKREMEAMFKLTVSQQRLHIIDRAFNEWMTTKGKKNFQLANILQTVLCGMCLFLCLVTAKLSEEINLRELSKVSMILLRED
jgi:hypothetical protein